MKITTLILSILLSTAALAENRADQIRLMEVDSSIEITEEEKDHIRSHIDELTATRQDSGLQYSEECLKCSQGSGLYSKDAVHIGYIAAAGVAMVLFTVPGGVFVAPLLLASTTSAGALSWILLKHKACENVCFSEERQMVRR